MVAKLLTANKTALFRSSNPPCVLALNDTLPAQGILAGLDKLHVARCTLSHPPRLSLHLVIPTALQTSKPCLLLQHINTRAPTSLRQPPCTSLGVSSACLDATYAPRPPPFSLWFLPVAWSLSEFIACCRNYCHPQPFLFVLLCPLNRSSFRSCVLSCL